MLLVMAFAVTRTIPAVRYHSVRARRMTGTCDNAFVVAIRMAAAAYLTRRTDNTAARSFYAGDAFLEITLRLPAR